MAAVSLKVDTQMMKTIAANLDTQAKKVRTNIGEIQRVMQQTGTYWYGEAANADRSEFIGIRDELDELIVSLEHQPQKMREIAGIIEIAEEQNVTMMQGLSKEDFV